RSRLNRINALANGAGHRTALAHCPQRRGSVPCVTNRSIREPPQEQQLMKANREPSRRRDQRAVASLHGLPVGPISLSTTPVSLRNHALVTSRLYHADAPPSVGTLAPALRYFLRPRPPRFGNAPLPFANIPTEATESVNSTTTRW